MGLSVTFLWTVDCSRRHLPCENFCELEEYNTVREYLSSSIDLTSGSERD
jgi:putative lipase involved disintegration of autophagic bodies